jgi:hypothetical protein
LICLGKHLAGITTLEIEDLRKGIILSLNIALEGDKMKLQAGTTPKGQLKKREEL